MDELLTLGCIALFFALVVVPILAIIAQPQHGCSF